MVWKLLVEEIKNAHDDNSLSKPLSPFGKSSFVKLTPC